MLITVICLLMEKKSLSLKLTIKNLPTQFDLGNISNRFSTTESKKNENVYDFSVEYSSVDKSEILNIRKCLMTQKNEFW